MITINTETLEAKLDRIIELLEGQRGTASMEPPAEPEQAEAQKVVPFKVEPETPATPAVDPLAEPETNKSEEEEENLLASISAMVRKLASPEGGKRAETKAIVNQYAAKVSDIPKDKLAEVLDRLTALEVRE